MNGTRYKRALTWGAIFVSHPIQTRANQGVHKTESGLSLEDASFNLAKKVEPVRKNSPNRIVKITFGKENNQGLRIISDENERKQFEKDIK